IHAAVAVPPRTVTIDADLQFVIASLERSKGCEPEAVNRLIVIRLVWWPYPPPRSRLGLQEQRAVLAFRNDRPAGVAAFGLIRPLLGEVGLGDFASPQP